MATPIQLSCCRPEFAIWHGQPQSSAAHSSLDGHLHKRGSQSFAIGFRRSQGSPHTSGTHRRGGLLTPGMTAAQPTGQPRQRRLPSTNQATNQARRPLRPLATRSHLGGQAIPADPHDPHAPGGGHSRTCRATIALNGAFGDRGSPAAQAQRARRARRRRPNIPRTAAANPGRVPASAGRGTPSVRGVRVVRSSAAEP